MFLFNIFNHHITTISANECIKPGIIADNYSINKSVNLYSNRHVFDQGAGFAFCHLFRM